MNYIIEGDIDFYAELNKKNDELSNNICMLSHQPLTENYITLPCNHKFNYVSIYHEVCTKLVTNNYDSDKLHNNEIKCPYCRAKFNKLLPYIGCYDGVEKKNGVNCPEKDCMKHMDCMWVYKSGKNKGQKCDKIAYKQGLEIFCHVHWTIVNKNNSNDANNANNAKTDTISVWTNEMESLFKGNHIVGLKNILKNNNLPVSGTKKILVKRIINAKIIYATTSLL